MSLRLQMLQVARRGASVLGDSADLVRNFLRGQLCESGAGKDRDGAEDLYYTIFVLAGWNALDMQIPEGRVRGYLQRFGSGVELDFVHLGALSRCWAAVGGASRELGLRLAEGLEAYRTKDGSYDGDPDAEHGNAYGCFVALGAYQDLGERMPNPLRVVQALKYLETPDGAWANARGLSKGSTNATAAAVTLLHQLELPVAPRVAEWLRQQVHPEGGFLAMPDAPMPDLLSTATALHALACLEEPLEGRAREATLDFLDTLWSAEGGFHGHWADDHIDAEYTFYGLLALGHLQ